jgi:hypothetical protein
MIAERAVGETEPEVFKHLRMVQPAALQVFQRLGAVL